MNTILLNLELEGYYFDDANFRRKIRDLYTKYEKPENIKSGSWSEESVNTTDPILNFIQRRYLLNKETAEVLMNKEDPISMVFQDFNDWFDIAPHRRVLNRVRDICQFFEDEDIYDQKQMEILADYFEEALPLERAEMQWVAASGDLRVIEKAQKRLQELIYGSDIAPGAIIDSQLEADQAQEFLEFLSLFVQDNKQRRITNNFRGKAIEWIRAIPSTKTLDTKLFLNLNGDKFMESLTVIGGYFRKHKPLLLSGRIQYSQVEPNIQILNVLRQIPDLLRKNKGRKTFEQWAESLNYGNNERIDDLAPALGAILNAMSIYFEGDGFSIDEAMNVTLSKEYRQKVLRTYEITKTIAKEFESKIDIDQMQLYFKKLREWLDNNQGKTYAELSENQINQEGLGLFLKITKSLEYVNKLKKIANKLTFAKRDKLKLMEIGSTQLDPFYDITEKVIKYRKTLDIYKDLINPHMKVGTLKNINDVVSRMSINLGFVSRLITDTLHPEGIDRDLNREGFESLTRPEFIYTDFLIPYFDVIVPQQIGMTKYLEGIKYQLPNNLNPEQLKQLPWHELVRDYEFSSVKTSSLKIAIKTESIILNSKGEPYPLNELTQDLKNKVNRSWHFFKMKAGFDIYIVADKAMNHATSQEGGINLNPAQMSMQIKAQGADFKFNFNGIEMDAAQVTGVSFTINRMTPVTNMPQVLGLT